MREILFRGKRIDNGKWLEGWYQPPVSGTHIDGRKENLGASIAFIDYDGFLEDAFIIPETVGQFTGLTDKNGKKIFEGDILEFRRGRTHIVKFEDGAFIFTDTAIPVRYADKFEVIGNIHDNPELLDGERREVE